jgi:tetratricopeptide (TPR) repeat protein
VLGKEFFRENTGHFWGLIETRPYMRARMQLAEMLQASDRQAEAISHYEALLVLNPNDNQGVRDVLINCYLAVGNLEGVRRLLREYGEDIGATSGWAKVMERFLSGDLPGAGLALKTAQKQNPFVELYLTGRKQIPPEPPSMYSLGSDEEALIVLELMTGPMTAHPEMLAWIRCALMPEFQAGDRNSRRLARRGKLPR